MVSHQQKESLAKDIRSKKILYGVEAVRQVIQGNYSGGTSCIRFSYQ